MRLWSSTNSAAQRAALAVRVLDHNLDRSNGFPLTEKLNTTTTLEANSLGADTQCNSRGLILLFKLWGKQDFSDNSYRFSRRTVWKPRGQICPRVEMKKPLGGASWHDYDMDEWQHPQTEDSLLTGDFLSIGLMMNFLSLKEMFLISLQGKPIFGVSLRERPKWTSIMHHHLGKPV